VLEEAIQVTYMISSYFAFDVMRKEDGGVIEPFLEVSNKVAVKNSFFVITQGKNLLE